MGLRAERDFDAVYAEHKDAVYGFCLRMCRGNTADAEDLAQDTFLQAHRALHQCRERASLRPWLFMIARRLHTRALRKERDDVVLDEDRDAEIRGQNPENAHVLRIWLNEAIEGLSDPLREALVLVKVEELTSVEAARILEIPEGTVRYRVHEAMKQLRAKLTEDRAVAAILPLSMLDHELRGWLAGPAPATLSVRVYNALGRRVPASVVAGTATRTASRGAVALAGLLSGTARRVLLGGVLLTAAVITAFVATRPPEETDPQRAAVLAMLERVADVSTARATGVRVSYRNGRDGAQEQAIYRLDYWYRLPGEYRREQVPQRAGDSRSTVVLSRGQGRVVANDPIAGRSVMAIDAESSVKDLSAFAFFSDSLLSRSLSAREAVVTVTDLEVGNRPTRLVAVERLTLTQSDVWAVWFDQRSGLIERAEHTRQQREDGVWRMAATTRLDRFEYNVSIPPNFFWLPPVTQRPDRTSRPG
jgi:RNA polymerase sigma-70 factor, ECF subfamily